jgi:hypothetical protein
MQVRDLLSPLLEPWLPCFMGLLAAPLTQAGAPHPGSCTQSSPLGSCTQGA